MKIWKERLLNARHVFSIVRLGKAPTKFPPIYPLVEANKATFKSEEKQALIAANSRHSVSFLNQIFANKPGFAHLKAQLLV